jgi:hypothetical protein
VKTSVKHDREAEEVVRAGKNTLDDFEQTIKDAKDIPADFVEWEIVSNWLRKIVCTLLAHVWQVCVTLYDWRTWPEQFAKSRDPDEKALYSLITKHVRPQVVEALIVRNILCDVTEHVVNVL